MKDLKGSLAETHPAMLLIYLFSMAVFGGLIFGYVAIVIIMLAFGVPYNDFMMLVEDPGAHLEGIHLLKVAHLMTSAGTFIFPALLISYLWKKEPSAFLRVDKGPEFVLGILTVLIVMSAAMPSSYLLELGGRIPLPDWEMFSYLKGQQEDNLGVLGEMLAMKGPGDLMVNLIIIAAIPALGEELLFRGVLMPVFAKWTGKVGWGIVISSVLFSAIHVQVDYFMAMFFLGAIFASLYYWSGNLWLPILAHFFQNGAQVVLLYLYEKEVIETNIDQVEHVPLEVVIPATLVFAVLFFFFRKRCGVPSKPVWE